MKPIDPGTLLSRGTTRCFATTVRAAIWHLPSQGPDPEYFNPDEGVQTPLQSTATDLPLIDLQVNKTAAIEIFVALEVGDGKVTPRCTDPRAALRQYGRGVHGNCVLSTHACPRKLTPRTARRKFLEIPLKVSERRDPYSSEGEPHGIALVADKYLNAALLYLSFQHLTLLTTGTDQTTPSHRRCRYKLTDHPRNNFPDLSCR